LLRQNAQGAESPMLASTRVLSQDLESSFEMLAPLFEAMNRPE